jgi:hypothetical protein
MTDVYAVKKLTLTVTVDRGTLEQICTILQIPKSEFDPYSVESLGLLIIPHVAPAEAPAAEPRTRRARSPTTSGTRRRRT